MLQKWLERAVDIIVDSYDPDKIILFGSVAKGTANQSSDIDLLVIKSTNLPRRLRSADFVTQLQKFPVRFDLLLYTPQELLDEQQKAYSFISSALKNGKILYKKVAAEEKKV